MASRPLVTIQDPSKKDGHTMYPLPAVLISPIRRDIVQFVHTNVAKNHRQPYAVKHIAGMDTAAQSWGTGRAVSRIPRVPGGGTHRAGQGAFGNMCRGGRMFAPTKTYRKWHRKVSKGQRRYATCSALAATAVPAIVLSRGHHIELIAEVPLVVADSQVDGLKKTKEAVALLKSIHAYADCEKSKASRKIRPGKGKARNRRYLQTRGPLIVHTKDLSTGNFIQAFRNIPGITLCNVNRLNLLQLAPGGHLGRFIVWTESAFKSLNHIFGTLKTDSKIKTGFRLPRAVITNADLNRLINSDEVQSVLRAKKPIRRFHPLKKNPLKNIGAMVKLNPFALVQKKRNIIAAQKAITKKTEKRAAAKIAHIAVIAKKAAKAEKIAKAKEAAKDEKTDKKKTDKKKTVKKPEKPKTETTKTKKMAHRTSKTFLSILHAPAVAPVRGKEELPPKY